MLRSLHAPDSERRPKWLALALILLLGCARGSQEGGDGGSSSSTTPDGNGGQIGEGGSGGSTAWPCGIDCSSIQTEACTIAECDPMLGQCQIVPADDGASCDDGLFCTVGESCQAGACTGGADNDCGLTVPACTQISCNETAQSCNLLPAPDNAPCTSDNLCIVNGQCINGLCTGQAKDCFFAPKPNECHVATCDETSGDCVAVPDPTANGKSCADTNDLCMEGKTCDNGTCSGGAPKDCTHLTVGCFNGLCDSSSGQCVADPVPQGGSCLDAADDCNVGECSATGNCQAVPANEGGSCEDGNSCTAGETCTAGSCGGGSAVTQVFYFTEDFADNAAGWSLGTEWAIGAATASSNHTLGHADPATDKSATSDNGVAGALLGDNVDTTVHTYYYLTSPIVDTSSVQGPLWLGYERWLNSDFAPYMSNQVQVFDGSNWVTLWESGASPGIADSAWTLMVHELSAYKNNQMRVRFGHQIGLSGAYTVSGWNIDDVAIANAICSP